ncbi:hypothetical protein [Nitrospira sp. Kam-Ns4a]
MKRCAWVLLSVWLAGCSGTAIIPAKVTYTYPLAGPSGYESPAGTGAVAYLDNGTLELYLPLFAPGQIKPQRFVFQPTSPTGLLWAERKDPDLQARIIQQPEEATSATGTVLAHLNEGMLLIAFPAKPQYRDLAGKQLWLTSTAGPDEVFHLRGLYWKSKAAVGDLVR